MKNKLLLFLLLIGIFVPLFVRAADTRLGSKDINSPACYTATVVSGATCYTVDSATTVSGTSFVDVKLISGTNPRMPGLWGNLGGTTLVTNTGNGGTTSINLVQISGTSPATPNLLGAIAGTTYTNSTLVGGTATVNVASIAGTSYVNATLIGGTSFIGGITGTSYVNANLIGGTSFVNQVGTATVSVTGITGTSFVTATLAGGTSFATIAGTGFINTIPNAIVTQGVGSKTVSTSGTSLRLSSQAARMVVVKANAANTASIYVVPGGTTSTDYSSTTNPGGIELAAKESITLPLMSNIQEIVIDATVNGEGINYTWIGY